MKVLYTFKNFFTKNSTAQRICSHTFFVIKVLRQCKVSKTLGAVWGGTLHFKRFFVHAFKNSLLHGEVFQRTKTGSSMA